MSILTRQEVDPSVDLKLWDRRLAGTVDASELAIESVERICKKVLFPEVNDCGWGSLWAGDSFHVDGLLCCCAMIGEWLRNKGSSEHENPEGVYCVLVINMVSGD